MPRSRRTKGITLTKTTAKGRAHKSELIESLRRYVDEYDKIFVFSFDNLRASKFRDVRMHFRESKIFLGKNSVAKIALGRSVEEEYKDNLHNISDRLEGNVGLLFTSREKDKILRYFEEFRVPEYAKAGEVPDTDIELEAGALNFPASMLDHFRKLGLIVEVDDTKLVLKEKFAAAVKGSPLTPEQAKVLVHMDKPLISFKMSILCYWNDGQFEDYDE